MAADRVNEIQEVEAQRNSQQLQCIEYIYFLIYIVLVHRQGVLHELQRQQPDQRTEGRTGERKRIRHCDEAGKKKLARLLSVQEKYEHKGKGRIMEKEGHDKAYGEPQPFLFHREIYRQQHQSGSDGTPHLDKVVEYINIGYINQQRAEHKLCHLVYCIEFQSNRHTGKECKEEMQPSSQSLDPLRHSHKSCLESGISEMEEQLIILIVGHKR